MRLLTKSLVRATQARSFLQLYYSQQAGEEFDPLVQWLARGAVKLVVCRL